VPEQVRDLFVGAVLREFADRLAAIAKLASPAVNPGYARLRRDDVTHAVHCVRCHLAPPALLYLHSVTQVFLRFNIT